MCCLKVYASLVEAGHQVANDNQLEVFGESLKEESRQFLILQRTNSSGSRVSLLDNRFDNA
jgi:hypothetical protein